MLTTYYNSNNGPNFHHTFFYKKSALYNNDDDDADADDDIDVMMMFVPSAGYSPLVKWRFELEVTQLVLPQPIGLVDPTIRRVSTIWVKH